MEWYEWLWNSAEIAWNLTIGLGDSSTIGEAFKNFLEPLVNILVSLLYFLLYPLISALSVFQFMISHSINTILHFFNAISYLINDLGYILNTFEGVFPSTWVFILSMIIMLNFGMRIYHYVKGISIAGFSLGG